MPSGRQASAAGQETVVAETAVGRQPSFDTFVATRSTADALAACRRLVDEIPARAAVCLLHGPSGTGKTHLLRAAAAETRRRGYRVRESTAIELRASLVDGIRRQGEALALSRGAIDVHLLIADDLQPLVPHHATQEAIARMFREAVAGGTSILLASGAPPDALPAFTGALHREPWYREIPLPALPAPEVAQVAEAVAVRRGLSLPAETVRSIAERSRGDIGVMHGLLTQVHAALRWGSDLVFCTDVLPE